MSDKVIQIGNEEWTYTIQGEYTHIWDADGVRAVCLRWKATEGEIKAAAYGYGAGHRAGEDVGRKKAIITVRRALALPDVPFTGE